MNNQELSCMQKQLSVNAIETGTVIDHIPSAVLFKVIAILQLDKCENLITFGTNMESKKLGKKAIIKVAGRYFADDEMNKITLIAPTAKFNRIENYVVVEKRKVTLPDIITNTVKCMNPKCVTNHEKIITRFTVLSETKQTKLLCHYCEKETTEDFFEFI